MELITLFARKELTTDPIDLKTCPKFKNKKNTVVYLDRECTQRMAIWPWHYSNCPRRGQKRVMLNCYRWKLEWVAEANATVAK